VLHRENRSTRLTPSLCMQITNENVRYAWAIVDDPANLSAIDTLILHALGVSYRQVERRDQMFILKGE
jgi:hypothetical protein